MVTTTAGALPLVVGLGLASLCLAFGLMVFGKHAGTDAIASTG
jgi:hypothetical protein